MMKLLLFLTLAAPAAQAQDIEVEVLAQDDLLKPLITRDFQALGVTVVDDVFVQKGQVVVWGNPIEDGKIIDEVTIYDYQKSEFPKSGTTRLTTHGPLRSLYMLQWSRNDKLYKGKQVALLCDLVTRFMSGTWTPPQHLTTTMLGWDEHLNAQDVEALKKIAVDTTSVTTFISVCATGEKDQWAIHGYFVTKLTSDKRFSQRDMANPAIGQLGCFEVTRYLGGAPIRPEQILTVAQAIQACAIP